MINDGLPAPGWADIFIVAGAVLLAAFVAFVWLAFFRKKQTHLHRHRHGHHGKKRRRREHRKLNPTLAQTGGLPPIRTEEKPPGQTPPP
jgi:hypothetical protein